MSNRPVIMLGASKFDGMGKVCSIWTKCDCVSYQKFVVKSPLMFSSAKIWSPIKCLFSLLNSIFVQRNRKVKLWKSLSPGHAPGETCTLKEEQAHSRASSRSKCQSGKLQGGSEGGKLRRTTLLLTSNRF